MESITKTLMSGGGASPKTGSAAVFRSLFIMGILACLPFLSCSTTPQGFGTWEGRIMFGFEMSYFQPCGNSEGWWVVDETGELLDHYHSVASDGYEQVYARLTGDIGPKGSYGHLGGFDRQFSITDIVEIRTLKPDDCS